MRICLKLNVLAAATGLLWLTAQPALAATEIQWWHSMSAVNGEWVNDLARQFNASQSDYKIVPTYKGSYDESMTSSIAAFRAGNAPDILQVFEVGTATMMASKGAIVPVSQVMKEGGVNFDPSVYIPAVASYYTAPNGQMLSLPFNSSTTVFYFNKDAFKAAGLPTDQAPATWPQVMAAAEQLKKAGHKCPFTTAWQNWTQVESFSAWHNVAFASQGNGLQSMDARLQVNSPVHVRHIENLAQMVKDGRFVYKGRSNVPEASFVAGECAMISTSSGFYGNVSKNAKFQYGIAPLPYYPDVPGAPQNTVIGGASLWVMAGKPADHYKGVARFFQFISSPQVQAASHQRTGYLPVTLAAYQLTEQSGFYQQHPGTDVAVTQMVRKVTDQSRGIRLGNYVQIRTIEDEELEQVWAGKKSAQQAMDAVVKRGNEQLERFQRANRKN
jgi:sn-glycerol 3-phosphate transport system substrate-binding protein